MDKFFTLYERVWSTGGMEITDDFYACFTTAYRDGDYAVIKEYIAENVSYAETLPHKNARMYDEVERWGHKIVKSSNNNGRYEADLSYTATLRFQVDASGKLTQALTPIVDAECNSLIGGYEGIVSVTNKGASKSGQIATYRFTIKCEQDVVIGTPAKFSWAVTEKVDVDSF